MATFISTTSTEERFVGTATAGDLPPASKERMRFQFPSFASLRHGRGEPVYSPTIQALGLPWQLQVFPRGDIDSSDDTTYVSIFLVYIGPTCRAPTIKYTISQVPSRVKKTTDTCAFDRWGDGFGYAKFCKREQVLNSLIDGVLVVDVSVEFAGGSRHVWFPKAWIKDHSGENKMAQILKPFDVKFFVDGREFGAHRSILKVKAKALLEFGNPVDPDEPASQVVDVPGVSKGTFSAIIKYIYEISLPKMRNLSAVKTFLAAADKFECTSLKLYAESIMVEQHLNPSTTAELLLLADSHSCALLKEEAIEMYKKSPQEVMAQRGQWDRLTQSPPIMNELLIRMALNQKSSSFCKRKLDEMDVGSLRNLLDREELDLDGTREMLVKRLKPLYEPEEESSEDESDDSSSSDSSSDGDDN